MFDLSKKNLSKEKKYQCEIINIIGLLDIDLMYTAQFSQLIGIPHTHNLMSAVWSVSTKLY